MSPRPSSQTELAHTFARCYAAPRATCGTSAIPSGLLKAGQIDALRYLECKAYLSEVAPDFHRRVVGFRCSIRRLYVAS
jgi:hypothetical protein